MKFVVLRQSFFKRMLASARFCSFNNPIQATTASLAQNNWKQSLQDKIVAIDCEMVGVGVDGQDNALARCAVVDFHGNVIYDKFVQPKQWVTDFRTQWSGIRKGDITQRNAVQLEEVSYHAHNAQH